MGICNVSLKPNKARHKQLIKQYGTDWEMRCEPRQVQCLKGDLGVLISSLCGNHLRWVRYPDDIVQR